MPVAHKSAISFGLVHIPINLYTATYDSDIGFNQLHKADGARVRYKKICTHCGKEVKGEDIIKGYQYEKNKYITVSDNEIEKIKTEKDKTIKILSFCQISNINPIYYDKTYHILPDKGGEKALELLRTAMMSKQKIGLGKTTFTNQEKLLIIIPRDDGLLLQTLLYNDDVKDIPVPSSKPKPTDAELNMAEQLINAMAGDFEPEKYKDEFQEKLKALILAKINGQEIKGEIAKPAKVIDLMEALKASLINTGTPADEKKRQKKSAG